MARVHVKFNVETGLNDDAKHARIPEVEVAAPQVRY
jgi:hypothetical protein